MRDCESQQRRLGVPHCCVWKCPLMQLCNPSEPESHQESGVGWDGADRHETAATPTSGAILECGKMRVFLTLLVCHEGVFISYDTHHS